MSILNVRPIIIGNVGTVPQVLLVETNDTLATVLAAGYANSYAQTFQFQFANYQMALILTTDESTVWANVEVTSGNVNFTVTSGNVTLPVVSGDFAVFDGVTGDLEDAGYSPSDATKTKVVMASAAVNANHIAVFSDTSGTVNDDAATAINQGDIQAGLNDEAGGFVSYPSAAASGKFELRAVGNIGNYTATLSNTSQLQQSTVYTFADAGSATQSVLTSTLTNPGFSSVIKCFDINATAASLATGGAAGVVTGGGYKIREIYLNSGGTNFSGGGGDRDIQISDGTNVFSVIPAATAQALVNSSWGLDTDLPFPVSVPINTTTAATLFIAYSGGTTDYAAGSLTLSFVLQKTT